jgi:ribosomal protein S18 acetylase RimI-like enzyme
MPEIQKARADKRAPIDRGADTTAVLDDPVGAALGGPDARLAVTRGRARRYPVDVSPFAAVPAAASARDWSDLAALAGPDRTLFLHGVSVTPPADWEVTTRIVAVQMTGEGFAGELDEEAVPLGPDDVPQMLDLAARTRPGPFLPGTVRLGGYLGVRRDGELVAMAGERMHLPGWTEISAVCTAPEYRGQGLAARLMKAVAAGIWSQGSVPMLHVAEGNGAIRLYEALGFAVRRPLDLAVVRVPSTD